MVASAHLDRGVGRHGLAGLFNLARADENDARHHQRLSARATFHMAAVDEQLVNPDLGHDRPLPRQAT